MHLFMSRLIFFSSHSVSYCIVFTNKKDSYEKWLQTFKWCITEKVRVVFVPPVESLNVSKHGSESQVIRLD